MATGCLNDEELADYLEGRLGKRERQRLERHLDHCDACFMAVSVASGVVRGADLEEYEPAPAETTKRALRTVRSTRKARSRGQGLREVAGSIAEGIQEVLSEWSWGPLGLQPVRSEKRKLADGIVVVRKSFSNGSFEIHFEKRRGHVFISVKSLKPESSKEAAGKIRVTLFRKEREVASHSMNGSGCQFDNIPFSEYRMLFKRNGQDIGEYHFDLREK